MRGRFNLQGLNNHPGLTCTSERQPISHHLEILILQILIILHFETIYESEALCKSNKVNTVSCQKTPEYQCLNTDFSFTFLSPVWVQ